MSKVFEDGKVIILGSFVVPKTSLQGVLHFSLKRRQYAWLSGTPQRRAFWFLSSLRIRSFAKKEAVTNCILTRKSRGGAKCNAANRLQLALIATLSTMQWITDQLRCSS